MSNCLEATSEFWVSSSSLITPKCEVYLCFAAASIPDEPNMFVLWVTWELWFPPPSLESEEPYLFKEIISVLVPHIFKNDGLLYSGGSVELRDFGDFGDAGDFGEGSRT